MVTDYFNSYVSRFWEGLRVSLHMFIFQFVEGRVWGLHHLMWWPGDCTFSCGGLGTAPSQAAVQRVYALWIKDNVECVFTEYINTMATKYRPSLTRAHKDKFLKLEDITHQFK